MARRFRVRRGVVYFPTLAAAREFGDQHAAAHRERRVVEYQLGFAVQLRPSGDYLGPDGRPSLSNR